MTLDELGSRLSRIDIRDVLASVVMDMEQDILDANRMQLYSGDKPSGNIIGTYRQPAGYYSRKKNRMNPRPGLGVADLFLTGDFYRSLEIDRKTSEIFSRLDHAANLVRMYGNGEDFLGLSGANVQQLQPEAGRRLKDKLTSLLFR